MSTFNAAGYTNRGFDTSVEQVSLPMETIAAAGPNGEEGPVRRKTSEVAVEVRQGCKSYGSGNSKCDVLKGFNMVVKENTIYGLLGSSGSGKTTILSCIVALRKLNGGNIYIYGQQTGTPESGVPGGRVGYMPQELALNYECTIRETLRFFSIVYGMTEDEFSDRFDYLIDLLGLFSHKEKIVGNLSDGQKRRVSLAVALIHQPDILILDEPTVGCDSLLRKSIWKYLSELVASNSTTVIVTTHYIEETRQADRVGIMRNGHLLVEDSPSRLLRRYNSVLLDDVVLQLCQEDENKKSQSAVEAAAEEDAKLQKMGKMKIRSMSQPFNDFPMDGGVGAHPDGIIIGKNKGLSRHLSAESTTSSIGPNPTSLRNNSIKASIDRTTSPFNRLRALLVKSAIVMIRNLWFILFLIAMPAICVFVFCIAVGSDPKGLKIGLINEENPGGLCDSVGPSTCAATNLSCHYLDSLDQSAITLVHYDNVEAALKDIKKLKLWGMVRFESEFSKFMFARFAANSSSVASAGSNETNYGSQIRVQLDMAAPSIGLTLQKLFLDAFRSFTEKLLQACEIDPTGRDIPIVFEEPIFGKNEPALTNYMGPGIGLGFIFFMGALTCGLTYIAEKKDGMLNRTLVAGVSTIEIIISHFMTQLVVLLIQIIIALVIIVVAFEVPCLGSPFLAFAILALNSVAGMSLGFLVATLCNEEKNAMLLAMGTVFPNYILAGLIWPIQSLPLPMQYFSIILPCTLAGEAFRSILLRGLGLSHPIVWYGFLSGGAWIVVYWIATIVLHRWFTSKK